MSEKHFSKEDIPVASDHMKRCSMLLVVRKTQIKTKMRCFFMPTGMVIIRRQKIFSKDVEIMSCENVNCAGRNVKWPGGLGK